MLLSFLCCAVTFVILSFFFFLKDARDITVGVKSPYEQWNFDCDDEVYAFDEYVEYNTTVEWRQIFELNDSIITNSSYGNTTIEEVLESIGWDNETVTLAQNDVLEDNGYPDDWVEYDLAWSTLEEGEYYLFMVCEEVWTSDEGFDRYCVCFMFCFAFLKVDDWNGIDFT